MYIKSVYDIDVCDSHGKITRMCDFKGKFVMIVNISTSPAFNDQLKEVEHCYQLFKKHAFVVLGFPCDQFIDEPFDDEDEMMITSEKIHQTTFPTFQKTLVNGKHTHPLFQYIKHALPGIFGTQSIKWNFTKFIIAPDGTPLRRFSPITNMEVINEYLTDLFEQNQ